MENLIIKDTKHLILFRRSVQTQGFEPQQEITNMYFKSNGIDSKDFSKYELTCRAGTIFNKSLCDVLSIKFPSNTTIYISNMNRLGFSHNDVLSLCNILVERGLTIVDCSQGIKIGNNISGSKLFLLLAGFISSLESDTENHK